MNTIRSIFSLPADSTRVSFKFNGCFAYRGVGYAYIIRPSRDGATATLRISRALMRKFVQAYWPKSQTPKMRDMVVAESGFGWWRVHSLSEVGDTSVHQFFRYLNLWVLAQQRLLEAAEQPAALTKHAPKYELVIGSSGTHRFLIDKVVPHATLQDAPLDTPKVSVDRLAQLAQVVNTRFGHEVRH